MKVLLRRWTPTLGVLLVASCKAPELSDPAPELQVQWRGHELLEGPRAFVLATSARAAGDAYGTVDAVASELERQGVSAGKGLVLAVDSGDAPLLPDAREAWNALQRWHVAATRGPEAAAQARAAELALQATPAEVLVKAVTAGVPRDEATLELPGALTERVDWVVVVPTGDALASASYAIVGAAIDRSFIPRISAYGSTRYTKDRQSLKREFEAYQRVRICETLLFPASVDAATRAAALEECEGKEGPLPQSLDRRLADLASMHVSRYWILRAGS